MAFHAPKHIKFNAVRRGTCWLIVDKEEPRRLTVGDCLVIAGSSFTLASDLTAPPVLAEDVFSVSSLRGSVGEGDDFSILGGSIEIDQTDGALLKDVLPPVLVIGQAAAGPIKWLLEQLEEEWRQGGPGARLICNDLLHMIFLHVLRRHLFASGGNSSGWFGGLRDFRVGRAMHAMHAAPEKDWSLSKLAQVAGQSRSAFAERFKRLVGLSPIDYLTGWRMRIAAHRLRRTDDAIAMIGADLGYRSESAFGAAFKRAYRMSPGLYRRNSRSAAPDGTESSTPSTIPVR